MLFYTEKETDPKKGKVISPVSASKLWSWVETQAELGDGYIYFYSQFHSFRRGAGRE